MVNGLGDTSSKKRRKFSKGDLLTDEEKYAVPVPYQRFSGCSFFVREPMDECIAPPEWERMPYRDRLPSADELSHNSSDEKEENRDPLLQLWEDAKDDDYHHVRASLEDMLAEEGFTATEALLWQKIKERELLCDINTLKALVCFYIMQCSDVTKDMKANPHTIAHFICTDLKPVYNAKRGEFGVYSGRQLDLFIPTEKLQCIFQVIANLDTVAVINPIARIQAVANKIILPELGSTSVEKLVDSIKLAWPGLLLLCRKADAASSKNSLCGRLRVLKKEFAEIFEEPPSGFKKDFLMGVEKESIIIANEAREILKENHPPPLKRSLRR